MLNISSSSVTLSDSLDLVLLLDGIGVALTNALGGGDDLVGEALAHALVRSEGGVPGALAHQVNGLVHSSEWAHVDGLTSDGTTGSNLLSPLWRLPARWHRRGSPMGS